MRTALLACALAAAASGCKGHSPNWVRVDMPLMGEVYGPADPSAEAGYAIAFHETLVHIAEARGRTVQLVTYREDGFEQETRILLEPGEETWSLDAESITQSLGSGALEWQGRSAIDGCLAEGPKKTTTKLALLPHGLARAGPGWVLGFSAVTKLRCEGGKKHAAVIDYMALFDEDWNPLEEPTPLRHGPQARVHAAVEIAGEPALAWATKEEAGISTAGSTKRIRIQETAREYPPLFVPTGGSVAVVTRPGNSIRVRLLDAEDLEAGVDATIDPGSRPLSVAAAWAGDRLGVFFGLDKVVGTGSMLQHILVEIFPDGTVTKAVKVYTQQSMAEDTAFTRHLGACFADGRYSLAWIADDGYSQDIMLQEVPLGGLAPVKKAWRRDYGEGYRALKAIAHFPTPPQYVLHYLTATAHLTYKHNLVLTALPTQR